MSILNGMRELQRDLDRMTRTADRDVQRIVTKHGVGMQRKMQQNAFFAGEYTVGHIRRNIYMTTTDGGKTAIVRPTPHYAPYVEYGTRFMASQPFVRPAFYAERELFIQSLRNLVR